MYKSQSNAGRERITHLTTKLLSFTLFHNFFFGQEESKQVPTTSEPDESSSGVTLGVEVASTSSHLELECYNEKNGVDYRGKKHTTKKGTKCWPWSEDLPVNPKK